MTSFLPVTIILIERHTFGRIEVLVPLWFANLSAKIILKVTIFSPFLGGLTYISPGPG